MTAGKPKAKAKPKVLTAPERRKRQVIFGALQVGLKAAKYCAALDARGLPVPLAWKEEGCPNAYTLAYKDVRWTKKIQDEKARFRAQFDKTSLSEREMIIEGNPGTRRTRQERG